MGAILPSVLPYASTAMGCVKSTAKTDTSADSKTNPNLLNGTSTVEAPNEEKALKEEPPKEEPPKVEPTKEDSSKEDPPKEEPVKEEVLKEDPPKEEPKNEEAVPKEEPHEGGATAGTGLNGELAVK